jgi:hypothetical protein
MKNELDAIWLKTVSKYENLKHLAFPSSMENDTLRYKIGLMNVIDVKDHPDTIIITVTHNENPSNPFTRMPAVVKTSVARVFRPTAEIEIEKISKDFEKFSKLRLL